MFNYKKADWDLFSTKLVAKEPEAIKVIQNATKSKDWDGIATTLTIVITEAVNKVIPKLKITKRSKP